MSYDREQAYVLAQLNRRRQLKEECLRESAEAERGVFNKRRERIRAVSEKLQGLYAVAEELPEGMNWAALLNREAEELEQLRKEERSAFDDMPREALASSVGENCRTCLLLLGGAIGLLRKTGETAQDSDRGALKARLSEISYLLYDAGTPI